MMESSFEFTKTIQNLLFYGWSSSSAISLVLTCFLMATFAIILEGTKMVTLQLGAAEKEVPDTQTPGEEMPNVVQESTPVLRYASKKRWGLHVAQTAVHVLRLVVGYFLMLAIMTYNAWFLIATVLGSGFGYFLFGPTHTWVSGTLGRDAESPSRGSDQTTSTTPGPRDMSEQNLLDD